jgi:ATP synthase protein I
MSNPDPLQDLKQRIDAAEAARKRDAAPEDTASTTAGAASGKVGRLVIDFSVPVLVGTGVGLWLDRRIETLPWFTLIFILLGFGAGIMNVFRLAGGYGTVGYRKPQTRTPPPEQATDENQTPRE